MLHRPVTTATHSVTVHERLFLAIGNEEAHRGKGESAFMGPAVPLVIRYGGPFRSANHVKVRRQ